MMRYEPQTYYEPPTNEEIKLIVDSFDKLFKATYTEQGKSISNIKVNKNIISEIEIRVHQRAAYYEFFHRFKMNEIKEAALRSYWILKYRPFSHRAELTPDKDEDENVFFAFWSLISTLSGIIRIDFLKMNPKGEKFKEVKIPKPLIKSAFHTFRECDMSKESMIEYANTLHAMIICYNK